MTSTLSTAPAPAGSAASHGRRCAMLAMLIAALFVSTALHYAHNYVEIEH